LDQKLIAEIIEHLLNSLNKETYEHSIRVSIVASWFIQQSGLIEEKKEKEIVILGALFHDVGKIGFEKFLQKKHLTSSEKQKIRLHSEWGEDNLVCISKEIRKVVRHHHERWDGKGYPDGLKEEEIPLPARIVSLIDAFDVMIKGRSYKKPKSLEKAIEELKKGAGSQFDPVLTERFVSFIKSSYELPIFYNLPP